MEVVDAEVTFLNEFRWCKEMMSWKEILLLLVGQRVHFPAPKNHCSKDVCLLSDISGGNIQVPGGIKM